MEKIDLRYGQYQTPESIVLRSALGIVLADQLDMDFINYYKGPRDARIAAIESAKRLDYYYKVVKPFILDFADNKNLYSATLVYGSTGAGACLPTSDIDLKVLYGCTEYGATELDHASEALYYKSLFAHDELEKLLRNADTDFHLHMCMSLCSIPEIEALRRTNMDRASFTEGDTATNFMRRLMVP